MTIKHAISGLAEMEAKIKRLVEIMEEAKTLAEELASCGVEILSDIVK